jgi:hypothetical protein
VVVCGLLVVSLTMLCYGSDTIMSTLVTGGVVRFFFGAGMGMIFAPATESVMGSLPPGRAGVGSAVNDTTRQTGQALGVAVLGSLFLTFYRHFVGGVAGLSAAATKSLHDSIGAAVTTRLPAPVAGEVSHLARDAFRDAMRVTYPIAAVIVLFAASVAWRFLPARPVDYEPVVPAEPARAEEAAVPVQPALPGDFTPIT